MKAEEIIKQLNLIPQTDEGGMFSRIYTSDRTFDPYGKRYAGTAIYYLLQGKELSSWHALKCDEIWAYHAGSPAIQLLLLSDGSCCERSIGSDLDAGEQPLSVIPAGTWQTTLLKDRSADSWGLFSTVCVPGFEYVDYRQGDPARLMELFPSAADKIRNFGLTVDFQRKG
ncbi:MAG: cupin domain-containing protein [Lentisphaeria bacterium]|nr:cupin domain-containing protein [Lentisphaeria bacterium]